MAFKLVVIGPVGARWSGVEGGDSCGGIGEMQRCVAFDVAMTTLPFLRLEACFSSLPWPVLDY
jgi:hypothetical protein